MVKTRLPIMGCCFLLFLVGVPQAQAQQLETAEAYEPVLEEVLVTARKRTENLQDVPISIIAIPAQKIRDADINRLEEFQTYVPNLTVTETGIGSNMSIRGIGSGENQGFEQSVGTYVDGIHHGRAQQSRIPFLDIDRIEVLRGPQSTMFGMNSIAGALSLTTAQPTATTQALVRALYVPEFSEKKLDGFFSGGMTDSLNGRLAIHWRATDDYTRNLTLDRDEANREERAIRGTLAWTPSFEWELILKLETSTFDSIGRNVEIVQDRTAQAGPFTGLNYAEILQLFGQDASVANNFQDYKRSSNGDSSDNDADEYVMTINYHGWGDLTLTSITGYSAYKYDELCDCDFTGANVFNAFFSEDYDQFSQEFRLSSPLGGDLDYVLGVFYQTSRLNFFDTLLVNDSSILIPVIDALAGPGVGVLVANTGTPRTLDQDTDTLAFFGQATWSINDRTRLNFGARLSHDKKSASRQLTITDIEGNPLPPETAPFTEGLYAFLFNVTNHDLAGSLSETSFMPSLSLQYDATDNTMLYGSFARGVKSGGFDARSNNSPDNGGTFEFNAEEADSFELGSKITLAHGGAEINLALFYTEFEDLQISTYDGVLGYNVQNAARAVSRGIEIDGRWMLTQNWLLSGSVAWTDFEFKEFQGQCWFGRPPDASDGINCDYSGQTNLMIPEYSGALSAAYNLTFGSGWGFNGVLDVLFSDDYLLTPNLDPRLTQDSFIRLNARLSIRLPNENWEIALIGKNITDEAILNFGNDVPLAGTSFGAPGFFAFVEQPRSVGLQLSWLY